jgi:Holin of 3TMs, for gene-transfer release
MDPITIGSIFSIGGKLIDKLFPDPTEKAKAQLELLRLQQSGELEEVKVQLSAIIAEAQSPDPWTSRARPSFLYVVYILLLWSLPMGVMFVFAPEAAERFTRGFGLWMHAIPDAMIALFGTVMLGYVGARSWEKGKGVTQ